MPSGKYEGVPPVSLGLAEVNHGKDSSHSIELSISCPMSGICFGDNGDTNFPSDWTFYPLNSIPLVECVALGDF